MYELHDARRYWSTTLLVAIADLVGLGLVMAAMLMQYVRFESSRSLI